jgi:hypothetical protein
MRNRHHAPSAQSAQSESPTYRDRRKHCPYPTEPNRDGVSSLLEPRNSRRKSELEACWSAFRAGLLPTTSIFSLCALTFVASVPFSTEALELRPAKPEHVQRHSRSSGKWRKFSGWSGTFSDLPGFVLDESGRRAAPARRCGNTPGPCNSSISGRQHFLRPGA